MADTSSVLNEIATLRAELKDPEFGKAGRKAISAIASRQFAEENTRIISAGLGGATTRSSGRVLERTLVPFEAGLESTRLSGLTNLLALEEGSERARLQRELQRFGITTSANISLKQLRQQADQFKKTFKEGQRQFDVGQEFAEGAPARTVAAQQAGRLATVRGRFGLPTNITAAINKNLGRFDATSNVSVGRNLSFRSGTSRGPSRGNFGR